MPPASGFRRGRPRYASSAHAGPRRASAPRQARPLRCPPTQRVPVSQPRWCKSGASRAVSPACMMRRHPTSHEFSASPPPTWRSMGGRGSASAANQADRFARWRRSPLRLGTIHAPLAGDASFEFGLRRCMPSAPSSFGPGFSIGCRCPRIPVDGGSYGRPTSRRFRPRTSSPGGAMTRHSTASSLPRFALEPAN
jgi:hypothetical protein